VSLINLLLTTLFRGCTVQDVRIEYSEDYPTHNSDADCNFVYLYADVMCRETERRGDDPIQSEALFVVLRLFKRR
jgi:hypothetical protein